MDAPEYLVEVDAHNGSTVVTLRYSMSGYKTGPSDTPANTYYAPVVKDPGSVRRSLFGDNKTMGMGMTGYGQVVLLNVDGALDALLTYGFDSRKIVVKRLANARAAFSTAVVVLRGTVERLDSDNAMSELRLRLYDRRTELDRPVQTNRYGGTTTSGGLAGHLADGTDDMKDQPKPLAFGTVFNITPVTVNPFDLIFQVSDGTVTTITAYDGRVPLTLSANYSTVALLQAATIAPGKYGTCLALGLFRLGCPTYYQLTADVVEGSTTALRKAGQIVQRILSKMGLTGGTNIDAASFTAIDTAAPQVVGIYLDGDQHGIAAIGEILSSVGGYLSPMSTGPFQVGVAPVLGSSTWALNANTIEDDDGFGVLKNPDTEKGLPVYRTILRHKRNYTVQAGEAVCPGTTAALKGFASKQWREVKDEDTAVQTKYPLAEELTIETLLAVAADATTEVARRQNLYGVLRYVLTVPVALEDADAMVLASTGTLTLDRFGWSGGKDFVIVEREDDFAAGQAVLTLWG